VTDKYSRLRNQIAYQQDLKENADSRLRSLLAAAPREVLDELVGQAPEPDPNPVPQPVTPPDPPPEPEDEPEDEPKPAAVLDAKTVERIRREARAYVDKQLEERNQQGKRDLEQRVRDDIIADLRRQAGLASHLDDLVEHTINCPPFTDRFIIDGIEYHHGYTYTMRRSLYDVMREIEARGWDAEDRAGNPNRKFYRRPEMTMNPLLRQRYAEDGHAISRETSFSALGGQAINAPINNLLAGGLPAQRRH
jgi:hypothetical protein